MTIEEKCDSEPVEAQTLTPTTSPSVDLCDRMFWAPQPLSLNQYYIDVDAILDETLT